MWPCGSNPRPIRTSLWSSGAGELHLGVLLENMRREGFEMAVSRPRVVIKHIDGVAHEPYEQVTVDADSDAQGAIMQALGSRGADLKDMQADGRGRVRLDYMVPFARTHRVPDRISHHDPRTGCCITCSTITVPWCSANWVSARMACSSATDRASPWPIRCSACRSGAGSASVPVGGLRRHDHRHEQPR